MEPRLIIRIIAVGSGLALLIFCCSCRSSDPRRKSSKQQLEKICVCWTGGVTRQPHEVMFVSSVGESEARAWALEAPYREWGVLSREEAATAENWEASLEVKEQNKIHSDGKIFRTGYMIEFWRSDKSLMKIYIGWEGYALINVRALKKALDSENAAKLSKIEGVLLQWENTRNAVAH